MKNGGIATQAILVGWRTCRPADLESGFRHLPPPSTTSLSTTLPSVVSWCHRVSGENRHLNWGLGCACPLKPSGPGRHGSACIDVSPHQGPRFFHQHHQPRSLTQPHIQYSSISTCTHTHTHIHQEPPHCVLTCIDRSGHGKDSQPSPELRTAAPRPRPSTKSIMHGL